MIFTLSAKPNEKAGESRVLPEGLLGGQSSLYYYMALYYLKTIWNQLKTWCYLS